MSDEKHVVIGPKENKVVGDKKQAFDEAARQVGKPDRSSRERVTKYIEGPTPVPKGGVSVFGDESGEQAVVYPVNK